ncbi:MAG: hypothetical protein ACJ73S_32050 [Mycobacteriales bacterium]
MRPRPTAPRHGIPALSALILVLALAPATASSASAAPPATPMHLDCATGLALCTEVHDSEAVFGEDVYVGHDEPAAIFYDGHPGAGNNNLYHLRLPTDPPRQPRQDGTGGTFNFQLHPAFWFGMAMCDNQSAPEFTHAPCAPDTDANIFDGADPADPHYIGRHPGTAFMEMQFYPPGWVGWPAGTSCDPTRWCAALTIDSLSQNLNTGAQNNADCLSKVGIEPVNFAFVTRDGRSQAPADPLRATTASLTPDPARDLFMNSGDDLALAMRDTPAGFRVDLVDLTSGRRGAMTASTANQFGQIVFDPTAATCTSKPYAFHPMYATASEHTRVPWAAHSFNVAFSDEIGHFEYCDAIAAEGGACTMPGGDDTALDSDDRGCFDAAASLRIAVTGCTASEEDFDGVPYRPTWPGATSGHDQAVNPRPIVFSSPRFNGAHRYARTAFETDLPRIEAADAIAAGLPPCDRSTGANCVNPPPNATFYPLYTTRPARGLGCEWQLGGAHIPGTLNTFGGSSTTEFGPLLRLTYPSATGPVARFNDFRRIVANPC